MLGEKGVNHSYIKTPEVGGNIIAVAKIFNNGRVQIPAEIRRILSLRDGDAVFWVQIGEEAFKIMKRTSL